jgi:guanine nucleotide-binding protein subunit alpha, other
MAVLIYDEPSLLMSNPQVLLLGSGDSGKSTVLKVSVTVRP